MFKCILRIVVTLFISPCIWAQTQPLPMQLTSTGFVGGTWEYDAPYDLTSPQYVTNSAIVTYKAGHQIRLLPGFKSYALNSTGKFHAYIAPSTFNVVSMNSTGWTVGMYERLELGVQIPDTFLNLVQTYFNITGSSGINPYDPAKLQLKCTFTNGSQSYTRDAFYYRDFQVVNHVWQEKPTDYKFRVRFCPPATGTWVASFILTLNGTTQPQATAYTYTIKVIPSSNKGHLSVDAANTRKFVYDDGTPFYAIAQNLWVTPSFHTPCQSQYLDCLTHDTYETHRSWINDLSENGGNLTRIRIDANQYPIEGREYPFYTAATNYFGKNDLTKPLGYFLNNYDNSKLHRARN